jgi:hypothetical protein
MTTSAVVVVGGDDGDAGGDDGDAGGDGDALTWTIAENRCRRLGMSLATPEEL